MSGAASLTAMQLRAALVVLDEAVEEVGAEESHFPGRERLNRRLREKGLNQPGEPDPW